VAFWQALVLGLLQGATELFPVSSLGHSVLLPTLLHWSYRQSDPTFVPFLVLLHLGTAGALLVLYFRDWVRIVTGFVRAALRGRLESPDERLAMLLLAGTIPGGLVGFLLEKPIKALFASPLVAAIFLIVNGLMLLGAELLRRRDERAHGQREGDYEAAQQLDFRAAIIVGTAQALALVPGISRSGVTMAGGLLAGLRHQEAARFSFLLATPIIGAAGVLELPQLLGRNVPLGEYLLAGLLAALAAYVSARFLIRYFKSGRLDPYGWYCLAVGAGALLLLR
jgi:undecaprenyl-diphosphatase